MLPVPGPDDRRRTSDQQRSALYLLRPEVGEKRFPRTYGRSIDGAIILGRLVADGGRSRGAADVDLGVRESSGEARDELARVARSSDLVHLHDPDTPVLAHLESHEDYRASMACRTAAALAVDLPVGAADLLDLVKVERLVRATVRSQVGVTRPAPPYFEFSTIDDPWLASNLASIQSARRLLPSRPLAVFVRASRAALMSGALAASAARYRGVLPQGAWIVLGVSGLHPEESSAEELGAYLGAVIAFVGAGFEVVADRVDHFGPAAVAAGAIGMAGGPRVYRVIPENPFWENEWSVKLKLKTAIPLRGDRMLPEQARKRRARGSVDPCPVPSCVVLEREVSNGEIRAHYGHLTQLELDEASSYGLEWLARRYESSPLAAVRKLGEAVRLAMREAKEA